MKKILKYGLIITALLISKNGISQEIISLDECLNQAMEQNQQLKIAENNLKKTTYQTKEILSNLWPKINGNFDYKYYFDLPTQLMPAKAFNPMAPEWEFKAAQFGVPHNINANVQVGMPLFNADLYSGIKISKIAIELQSLNYTKTKEETYVLVSNLYYNAQIIKNQILFNEKNKENLTKLLKDLQLFYEQELATKNDVDKVRLQIEKLNVNIKLLKNKYSEIISALKLNTGIQKDFEVQTEIITPELKNITVKNSTELNLIEKKYDLVNAEVKKMKKGRLPKLSLYGSYGTIGYGYDEKPHDFLDFYDVSLVGVKLEMPLFDLSRKHKIQQKKIDKENVKIQWDLAKEKNQMDIVNTKNKLQVQLEVIENKKEQIALAKSIYKKTLLQHKQEMASLTEVLLAENDIIQAEQDYLSSVIEYLKTNLELKKLTGNLISLN